MITEDLNLQDLTLEISSAFNDTGAYWKLIDVLSNQNKILNRDEIEELVRQGSKPSSHKKCKK